MVFMAFEGWKVEQLVSSGSSCRHGSEDQAKCLVLVSREPHNSPEAMTGEPCEKVRILQG